MGSVWILYGFCMDSVWVLFGFCVGSVWILWGFFMDSVGILYGFFFLVLAGSRQQFLSIVTQSSHNPDTILTESIPESIQKHVRDPSGSKELRRRGPAMP